jgi:hypothetical protein
MYKPSGACWCWFYDTFARGLFAPGDPAGADCVFTGLTWPLWWTNPRPQTQFPAQTVSARIAAVATQIGAVFGSNFPVVSSDVATQNQLCEATVPDTTTGFYPGFLQVLRDAAATGVASLVATAAPAAGAVGHLVLNYARWETLGVARTIDRSQIVAGPPTTADTSWPINTVEWAAIDAAGAQNTLVYNDGWNGAYSIGAHGPGSMRLWGDVTPAGPEYAGAHGTAAQLCADYNNTSEQLLSTISLQSGTRFTPDGKPSAADWDPYAHHLQPSDVASITDDAGAVKKYRVTKSDHRLTARVWQTTHTLAKFSEPSPLP